MTTPDATVRELRPVDRIAQYVLVPRIAVAGLTVVAVPRLTDGLLVLLVAIPLVVALNYLALRHWIFVVDVLEVTRKPLYLVLDMALAISLIALVGIGTPLVLYLVGTGLLGGLLYRARLALTAGVAMSVAYGVLLAIRAGSVPGALDVHTGVTIPALILASGPAASALRRLLVRHERASGELARLREDAVLHDERLRLARDLHDNVTKSLHGISLLCTSLVTALDRRDTATAHAVSELVRRSCLDLAEQTREVIHDLREPSEQSFGGDLELIARLAVRGHPLEMSIAVEHGVDAVGADLAPRVRQETLAIVAEAVHNTVKHAAARALRVSAAIRDDALTVRVDDDGIGFSPARAARRAADGHFGVMGMHERAEHVGAELRIDGSSGAGTSVSVSVPLRGKEIQVSQVSHV
jgi:signal transduction histidine kinase